LLADVVSDMKSNMTFLAPLLAGIVVGLASMITLILSRLSSIIGSAELGGTGAAGVGGGTIGTIVELFNVENMIPPYILQICVGVYIIEIIFILTRTLVTVDSGEDKLKTTYETGKNLFTGGMLYTIVAFLAIVGLSLISSVALAGIAGAA
jgi:hypothetical protein